MTSPTGKFTSTGTNAMGSTIIIVRCVLSIVVDMKYVDASWLPT